MTHRRLAVVFGGSFVVSSDGRHIELPDKLLTGLTAFAERWPGPVTLVGRRTTVDETGNLGVQTHDRNDLPFDFEEAVDANGLRRLGARVALVPINTGHRWLGVARSTVIVAENPALEELRATVSLGLGRTALPRAVGGTLTRAYRYRRVAASADGVQCNGYPASSAFGRWSKRSLLYFDTRLAAADVGRARALRRPSSGPLRLGFSGRLSPEKGPQFAASAQRRLAASGAGTSLVFFGSGPLEGSLRSESDADGIRLAGAVPFRPDWVSRVPAEVDLMVLPHPQGDPAGTYLESAGLGVPFVGFNNVALKSLVRHHDLGWGVPIGDVAGLVSRVRYLDGHRHELDRAAERGFAFMAEHCFEREFDRRVEHLLACAGL